MLNADNPDTVSSLLLLREVCRKRSKPLALWVGAGASRWLKYPSWKETALAFRKAFFQVHRSSFDNARALALLNAGDYPALFQLCRDVDEARYNRLLAETFGPQTSTPLYDTFLAQLRLLPVSVVTTNIDESLETRLPDHTLVQRSDLSRTSSLLHEQKSFIAKLHGTVSAIASTVFTTRDYEQLVSDSAFLHCVDLIFSSCTVIFLGYGVRDNYLIDLLTQQRKHFALFGSGPHFAVTTDAINVPSIHRIDYHVKLYPDHRAAVTVLSYIRQAVELQKSIPSVVFSASDAIHAPEKNSTRTAYYISDIMPAGTWQTSQVFTAKNAQGTEIKATTGLGFTNDEVPFWTSTAMHDVAVGLTCFDALYFPLSAAAAVHQTLGSELFWPLVESDIISFVHIMHIPSVVSSPDGVIGDLGIVSLAKDVEYGEDIVRATIRGQIRPMPGREGQAEKLLDGLEKKTAIYAKSEEIELPSLIRGALLMPSISQLLGISDAILPTQVPMWLVFSYLRLAHLVQTSAVCSAMNFQAAKLPFGGVQLTGAAFSVQPAEEHAEEYASYIYSGRFNTDLGTLLLQDLSLVKGILRFRESAAGQVFRREIRDKLLEAPGTEFPASVNAGLHRSIPKAVLERAYDQLSILMTSGIHSAASPAVWSEVYKSDNFTRYWRQRSFRALLDLCKSAGLRKDDPCICGSGEKVRVCCMLPLKS